MRKQQILNVRIEKHRDGAQGYLPPQAVDYVQDPEANDAWVDDDDVEIHEEGLVSNDLAQLTLLVSDNILPETKPIFLPSTIGYERCHELGLQTLVKNELILRQGEANDALQVIRIGIGEKSFRFRQQLRNSKSKVQKTRSWDAIHTVDKRLQQYRLVYRQARHAMIRLGASKVILGRYQEIKACDLHTNTAIQEPNARGQRNQELSWIWKMPGGSLTNQETLLHECEMSCHYCHTCCSMNHLSQCIGSVGSGQNPAETDGMRNS